MAKNNRRVRVSIEMDVDLLDRVYCDSKEDTMDNFNSCIRLGLEKSAAFWDCFNAYNNSRSQQSTLLALLYDIWPYAERNVPHDIWRRYYALSGQLANRIKTLPQE